MRAKKALANIIVSFLLNIITAICGFVVSRIIIASFGSEINGLISSINQFLSYIALIEGGVGGVVRASLYKPLAKADTVAISRILKATENFFKKVAYIFVGYVLVLSIAYPYLVENSFQEFYTSLLIIIMGISTFVQYYFGITYQMLINADQKQYITNIVQILTTVVNTILILILITIGANIHIVKLGSALVFICRPIFFNIYVRKKYRIISNCDPDNNAIGTRWDGMWHHLAYFVHRNTDMVVITMFSGIKEVSVYSVYYMIVNALEKIVRVFSSGVEAAFGNMISNNEKQSLLRNFGIFNFINSIITNTVFTVAGIMIMPFVSIYIRGITDANYYRPLLAVFVILAEAVFCYRLPYQSVTLAAGKYKETRNGALGEAIINIVLSVILINFIGITGVAIGTCIAMAYRTIQYAIYASKYILNVGIGDFIKKIVINTLNAILMIYIFSILTQVMIDSYERWIVRAVIITCTILLENLIVQIIFYYKDYLNILSVMKHIVKAKS